MTPVPAKQKQGANFVPMSVNPTNATRGRPIATAVTTNAAPRMSRIATALNQQKRDA